MMRRTTRQSISRASILGHLGGFLDLPWKARRREAAEDVGRLLGWWASSWTPSCCRESSGVSSEGPSEASVGREGLEECDLTEAVERGGVVEEAVVAGAWGLWSDEDQSGSDMVSLYTVKSSLHSVPTNQVVGMVGHDADDCSSWVSMGRRRAEGGGRKVEGGRRKAALDLLDPRVQPVPVRCSLLSAHSLSRVSTQYSTVSGGRCSTVRYGTGGCDWQGSTATLGPPPDKKASTCIA